jgi:hypothetical protein
MQPLKDRKATLVDLLERVLDRGIVLTADLVVHVSGVPLLGVNLRAALAGMKTMLKYGLMVDLDRQVRNYYAGRRRATHEPPLKKGERVLLQMMGSYLYQSGVMRMWRIGHLYLTDRRLILYRWEPEEKLLEVALEDVDEVELLEVERLGLKREEILLKCKGEDFLIHAEDVQGLYQALLKAVGGRRVWAWAR